MVQTAATDFVTRSAFLSCYIFSSSQYSLSLNDYCSYWLCISACALAAPLSAQASDLQGTLYLPHSKKPSRGSLPWAQTHTHTWPLTSTHSSYGCLKFYLPFPLHLPFFFLLCVPCVIFGRAEAMNRMSIFSSTPFFPKVFNVRVSLLNASVCLWMGC